MDKLGLLREFEAFAGKVPLGADEVGLYLLFLANSDNAGCGAIARSSVRAALGKSFSLASLISACRRLQEHGMVEVLFTSAEHPNTEKLTLTYRLLPFAKPGLDEGA